MVKRVNAQFILYPSLLHSDISAHIKYNRKWQFSLWVTPCMTFPPTFFPHIKDKLNHWMAFKTPNSNSQFRKERKYYWTDEKSSSHWRLHLSRVFAQTWVRTGKGGNGSKLEWIRRSVKNFVFWEKYAKYGCSWHQRRHKSPTCNDDFPLIPINWGIVLRLSICKQIFAYSKNQNPSIFLVHSFWFLVVCTKPAWLPRV